MAGHPTTSFPVASAVAGRCPRCGRGPLFTSMLNLTPACLTCGLDYRFVDTGDGPAVFAIFILGFLVLGGALWLEFTYEPRWWVHVLVWGVVTPVIALAILRFLKGLLIGLQYYHQAEEGRLGDQSTPNGGDGS